MCLMRYSLAGLARNERLSAAKPAGRNRFYKLRLDPAVTRCDKVISER